MRYSLDGQEHDYPAVSFKYKYPPDTLEEEEEEEDAGTENDQGDPATFASSDSDSPSYAGAGSRDNASFVSEEYESHGVYSEDERSSTIAFSDEEPEEQNPTTFSYKTYSDKIIDLLTQWLDRVQRQYETKLFVEIDIYEQGLEGRYSNVNPSNFLRPLRNLRRPPAIAARLARAPQSEEAEAALERQSNRVAQTRPTEQELRQLQESGPFPRLGAEGSIQPPCWWPRPGRPRNLPPDRLGESGYPWQWRQRRQPT